MSTDRTFVLRQVAVLDQTGGFTGPVDIKVEGGVVTAVQRNIPTAGQALDGEGLFVLPGLFDCHAHLGAFGDDCGSVEQMSITRWTLQAAATARQLLELGITFVRDVATADAGIRDALAAGAVPGPTLQVSGLALSQTGGHADGYLPSLGIEAYSGRLVPDYPGRGPFIADGVDEVRKAVRRRLRSRVDWIKLTTTGGFFSHPDDDPDTEEFTLEEIQVAVSEAARVKVPVAAHAYGGPGLDAAVAGGVRSIEHGLNLTEEQAAAMAAHGCWLVPTLATLELLGELAGDNRLDAGSAAKLREVLPRAGQAVAIAREYGVRIAMGTDLLWQGRNLRELLLMHAAGMPAHEVLLAATAGGAELCGVADHRGRLEPGQIFDALLFDQDPSDLSVFDDPSSVGGIFQAGRTVRAHPRFAACGAERRF